MRFAGDTTDEESYVGETGADLDGVAVISWAAPADAAFYGQRFAGGLARRSGAASPAGSRTRSRRTRTRADRRRRTGVQDKPVILSFDDGKDNQVLTALPELAKRGMVGTWFIMTVVIGNSGWTTADQIRAAADAGHTIGCHTWDHHDVRKYGPTDFVTQVDKARATLQKHSGQPVDSFAFPYGAWNEAALPHLASAGFTTAYQLTDKPLDPALPQYTLRRQLALSTWTGDQVVAKLDALRA